jgi:hypothetical protein
MMRSLHAKVARWRTRHGPSATSVSPDLWTSHVPVSSSFPPKRAQISSRHCPRLPVIIETVAQTGRKTTAKLFSITCTMSADDIDDELFALAGGDEDADVEEGEA